MDFNVFFNPYINKIHILFDNLTAHNLRSDTIGVPSSGASDHSATVWMFGDKFHFFETLKGVSDDGSWCFLVVTWGGTSVDSSTVNLPQGATANTWECNKNCRRHSHEILGNGIRYGSTGSWGSKWWSIKNHKFISHDFQLIKLNILESSFTLYRGNTVFIDLFDRSVSFDRPAIKRVEKVSKNCFWSVQVKEGLSL